MTARALYLPEHRGLARWSVAAVAILAAHLAFVGAVAWWYTHATPEQNLFPAIVVSFAPTPASAPQKIQDEDAPIAPVEQQVDPTPPEPPKVVQEEKPVEQPPPPPPKPAEIALPKPEPKPKPVQKPTPPPRPVVTETHVLQKSERIGAFSPAASNQYNSLVFGHLQRYKRYPDGAGNAGGTVVLHFALNRAGGVISSSISRSSGNAALDQAALEMVRRANPFPAFPEAKPGSQDSFVAPVNFSR